MTTTNESGKLTRLPEKLPASVEAYFDKSWPLPDIKKVK